jgi:hypothetical protein
VLLGKTLLAAAEPSFRAATAIGVPRKPAQWNVFPVEQVCCLALLVSSAYSLSATLPERVCLEQIMQTIASHLQKACACTFPDEQACLLAFQVELPRLETAERDLTAGLAW